MSAIGAAVTTEETLGETLEELVHALEQPHAEEIELLAEDTRLTAGSADELELAEVDSSWVLVHVTGPEPAGRPDPARSGSGLAVTVEDAHLAADGEEGSPAETVVDQLATAQAGSGELGAAMQELASQVKLATALGATDGATIGALRDRTGAVPVYFARGEDVAALASTQKALWRLGLDVRRLKPDALLVLHPERSQTIHLPQEGQGILGDDGAGYAEALASAVRRRAGDVDEVGLVATHPAASRLIIHALRAETDTAVHAFVPERDGKHADQIEAAIGDEVDQLDRVPLEAEALVGRVGELLHALELRHQTLAADGLPAFLAASEAASADLDVVLTDRAPDEPHAPAALALTSPGDADQVGPLVGEGPLERAHKAARAVGVALRAPRASTSVQALETQQSETYVSRAALLEAKLDEIGLEAPATVESPFVDLRDVLERAVETLGQAQPPEVYSPAESLAQAAEGTPTAGRAVVDAEGPRDLDPDLQWGLDHAAVDAGALGPGERQRLQRYLEDVQAYQAQQRA